MLLGNRRTEPAREEYFSADIITSLVLTSYKEFSPPDIVEDVIALKKAVSFEMRHYGRVVSTDDEVRVAVEDLLTEGVHEGWIEAVTARYADRCRESMPLRLKELLMDSPTLRKTLAAILVHIALDSIYPESE